MRAFGILAAFAAISTVLAAPLPVPPHNGLAVRHDGLVEVENNGPIANAVAKVNVVPRDDNAVAVNADVAGVVVDLKVDVDALVIQIKAILADTTSDVTTIVSEVLPLINKLVSDITTATAKVGLDDVGNTLSIVDSVPSTVNVANLTIQDVAGILKAIETDIVDILTKVATLIGDSDPAAAAAIQAAIAVLNLLTTTLGGLVGDLTPLLTPLNDLVAPILAVLGISVGGN